MSTKRRHMDCMPDECLVGDPDCPISSQAKKGQNMAASRPIKCPDCGHDHLHTLETSYGHAVTVEGVWIDKNGKPAVVHEGYTDPLDWDIETVGLYCPECSWHIERPDWFEYMKDFEANELQRIKDEFEKIKRGEDNKEQA